MMYNETFTSVHIKASFNTLDTLTYGYHVTVLDVLSVFVCY